MARVFTNGGWGIVIVPLVIVAAIMAYFLIPDKNNTSTTENFKNASLELQFNKLPPNKEDHYEVWLRDIYGGEQVVGSFKVLEGGSVASLAGDPLSSLVLQDVPVSGADVLVTLEDGSISVGKRSERVILAGKFKQLQADLKAPFDVKGDQFAILANPTLGTVKGSRGVWFAKSVNGKSFQPGLQLPKLSAGWSYGSWLVTEKGENLFMGFFSDPAKPDKNSNFSDTKGFGNVPGEDFIRNAPDGLDFPLDLGDGKSEVVVSAEPDYRSVNEESGKAFLPLLTARIPYKPESGVSFALEKVKSDNLPNGTVTIVEKK